jgi:hypothetical protein
MERHLTAIGEDAGAFRDANDFYRRALVIRDAATKSGASPAIGHITPSNLAQAAESVYGEQSRATGANPFSELARNGQIALGDMNNSGTPGRQHVRDLLKIPGGLLGAGLGFGAGHLGLFGPTEGILAGLWLGDKAAAAWDPIVRMGLRNTVLSGPAQRLVGNQLGRYGSDALSVPGLLGTASAANAARSGEGQ